ncbi:MAG: TMEM43 family protein [Alphaproteobacteria bacterium]|nr:TMEM43 family protein [Alphaproteobacteria bacterium]
MRNDLMQGDDSFTKVTHTSWLGRIGGTIAGAFVGLILFIASFVLLYWNEGRAVDAIIALDAASKQVVSVSAETVVPANEGRLIHLSGLVDVTSNLVDPAFHVTATNAIRLQRRVEMFQWRENKETRTEKKMGGGETETTTYTYIKEWSDEPIASSSFESQQGHANPAMPYQSKMFDVKSARLGGFTLDQSQITQLSNFETLAVEAEDGNLPRGFRWEGEYLYRGKAPDQPQISDLRVTFHNVPVQTISVIAQQRGSTLASFRGERERTINMVSYGTLGAEAMIEHAKSDEAILTWILRAGGFFIMLFGLVFMTRPLSWLASLLPFLESLVNAASIGVAFMIATPLTLTIIAAAWLIHRPLIGAALIAAGLAVAVIIKRLIQPARAKG